jgi:membrane protease YdiL (CAAX protease family)
MLKAVLFVAAGIAVSLVPVSFVLLLLAPDGEFEEDPAALAVAIGSSVIFQLLMGFAAWRWAVDKYSAGWSSLGLRKPKRGSWWLPFVLLGASWAVMFAYFTGLAEIGIEPDTGLPEQAYENMAPLLTLAALSLFFAPVFEEIFFRGFLFAGLRCRWGLPAAALASGMLFGIVHTLNPGFYYVVPPIALVGVIFALGYAYSGSIYHTMATHFMFNAVSFSVGLLDVQ